MKRKSVLLWVFLFFAFFSVAKAQLVINEGSNRNYQLLSDEDGDYPDWIELYNAGNVLRLGAVADFGAQNCQYSTKVDAR
jgi:hypothetical protein